MYGEDSALFCLGQKPVELTKQVKLQRIDLKREDRSKFLFASVLETEAKIKEICLQKVQENRKTVRDKKLSEMRNKGNNKEEEKEGS
jgi:hypothetical protein